MNQTVKRCLMNLAGGGILAFGLYNVHALSNVTEGGILGMTLFLRHWFSLSPAWTSLAFNLVCYFIGFKILGWRFIGLSAVAAGGFSLFYAICELFPPLWPSLAEMPVLAAFLGAVFVGVGCGLCVRAGGAPTGDDALAMSISQKMNWDIRYAYLISDFSVLLLSATYIDFKRLLLSFLTVILSGQIVGLFQKREVAD